jgi:hypothetical protein
MTSRRKPVVVGVDGSAPAILAVRWAGLRGTSDVPCDGPRYFRAGGTYAGGRRRRQLADGPHGADGIHLFP